MRYPKKWTLFILFTFASFGAVGGGMAGNHDRSSMEKGVRKGGAAISLGAIYPINVRQMMTAGSDTEGGQMRNAAEGPWGGDGVQLTVSKERSTIEYACADGEIMSPFRLDRNGSFRLNGSHVRLRPGPVREDQKELREPAIYEGRVTGERMVLKVSLVNSRQTLGEFRLQKGVVARIRRCL